MTKVLFGDGNGNRGLVRKVDGQEYKLTALLWLNCLILAAVVYAVADKIF